MYKRSHHGNLRTSQSCSLPGVIVMFVLSVVVQRMGEILPNPVYALLSGLNASTVGVIAVAAVQLAGSAITDNLSRIIVIFAACAGICYNSLWYFPVLMVVGGLTTVLWDKWIFRGISKVRKGIQKRKQDTGTGREEMRHGLSASDAAVLSREAQPGGSMTHRGLSPRPQTPRTQSQDPLEPHGQALHSPGFAHGVSVKVGLAIIVGFLGKFDVHHV